jgi:tetraacyldisaccharide 4'-kinase
LNRTHLTARLERTLNRVWRTRGFAMVLLAPLSWLYGTARALHAWSYRLGLLRPWRVGVPVVVVGNLYVGGTGKTPLTLELVRALAERGHRPGVVTRGYGAHSVDVRIVETNARAGDVGDEPLLMAQTLQGKGVPVVVGRDRVSACRILLSVHPRCDVIVADDGLQHRRLGRDFEIALIDERGLGNGLLLPAGPLRDPPSRLREVSAVVCHGVVPPVRVFSPRFEMQSRLGNVHSLADSTRAISLDGLVAEQQRGSLRILAAAGIGVPERFFAMLRAAGLAIEELSLPDHYDYAINPFLGRQFDLALITAKDAVKCRAVSAIATDGRMCVVHLQASVDARLIDLIETRLVPHVHREGAPVHGPSAA